MVRRFAAVLGMAWGIGACGFDPEATMSVCVEGQQEACSCSDGSRGARTCEASSSFGECDCSRHNAGAAGHDAGSGLPQPEAAGSSAGSGASGTAGNGTGGAGVGGAGTGGTAGQAGASGMDANAGGAGDGNAGSGGEAGGSSGSGGRGERPKAGDPYTHCADDTDCNDGLFCAASERNGQPVGYCASFCSAAPDGSCPQPTSGTVEANCFPFANLCLLGTCQDAVCPDDMRCIESSSSGSGGPFGGGGTLLVCEYPVHDNEG
jgi:hypothetical protein